jgi:hypothetical protein
LIECASDGALERIDLTLTVMLSEAAMMWVLGGWIEIRYPERQSGG